MSSLLVQATKLMVDKFDDNPATWIKDDYAREKPKGDSVESHDERATCFCLAGMIQRVVYELEAEENPSIKVPWSLNSELRDLVEESIRKEFPRSWKNTGQIEVWNDRSRTTFAQIKRVVCRAHEIANEQNT